MRISQLSEAKIAYRGDNGFIIIEDPTRTQFVSLFERAKQTQIFSGIIRILVSSGHCWAWDANEMIHDKAKKILGLTNTIELELYDMERLVFSIWDIPREDVINKSEQAFEQINKCPSLMRILPNINFVIENWGKTTPYDDFIRKNYTLVEQDEIIPDEAGEITLWHGGRDLQYDYREVISHGKGRWEYGPGLYLTNDRSIAQRYAKGSRRLYRVTINISGANCLEDTPIPLHDAVDFVERNVKVSLRTKVIDDLTLMYTRRGNRLFADTLVNLCINWEAISNSKTDLLRQFLIDHGIDYAHVDRYGGRNGSEVYVVINPRIITRVEFANATR